MQCGHERWGRQTGGPRGHFLPGLPVAWLEASFYPTQVALLSATCPSPCENFSWPFHAVVPFSVVCLYFLLLCVKIALANRDFSLSIVFWKGTEIPLRLNSSVLVLSAHSVVLYYFRLCAFKFSVLWGSETQSHGSVLPLPPATSCLHGSRLIKLLLRTKWGHPQASLQLGFLMTPESAQTLHIVR